MHKKTTSRSGLLLAVLLLLLCLLTGCTGAQALTQQDLVLLYTNDVHCAVEENIGYAGLAAYKNQLTQTGCQVLLVDCGDAIQGAPMGSLSQGEDIIKLMNKLGYTAAIPGNHEFDYGVEQLQALAQQADFPYLCANFTDLRTNTNQPVFAPYTMVETAGIKLALVGVTTPLTITSSSPTHFMDEDGNFCYSFGSGSDGQALYDLVQKTVDNAQKAGADYVIALCHLGQGDAANPYTAEKLIANTNGINAVLDGHSHSIIECAMVQNNDGGWVLLSQTGTQLHAIGMLLLDQQGNLSTGLISDYSEKDPTITAEIASLQSSYQAFLEQEAATVQDTLYSADPQSEQWLVRKEETNLGDLCADAYRAAAKADIAFVNGGGIRSNLPAGSITYGNILQVFPYGNMLCKVEVTGQELLDALELSVHCAPENYGGFLQVSGLCFQVDLSQPSPVLLDESGLFTAVGEGPRRVQNVLVNGIALNPDATYTLVSHDYLLKQCGDGYTMFADNTYLLDQFTEDYTALIDYLNGGYLQNPAQYQASQNRIQYL